MVRIIVGTLLAVGNSKITEEDIAKMLKTGVRSIAVKTMEAKGLALYSVIY